MAYIYKRIDELSPLASLNNSDQFIVARSSGTGANYATYRLMFSQLSSQVKIEVQALRIIIDDIARCNGQRLSAASARLTYDNYQKCVSLSTQYNALNTTVNNLQTAINSINSSINTINTQIQSIINTNYMPMYNNQAPYVTVYKFMTAPNKNKYEAFKTAYLSSGIYWNQEPGTISCVTKEFKDKPLVHKVKRDSNVVVTTDMSQTFIFMNNLVNGSTTKQYCHDNHATLSGNMRSLGTSLYSYDPAYIGQCKAGTILFIYDSKKFNSKTARLLPNIKDEFGSNQVIRIEEFPLT